MRRSVNWHKRCYAYHPVHIGIKSHSGVSHIPPDPSVQMAQNRSVSNLRDQTGGTSSGPITTFQFPQPYQPANRPGSSRAADVVAKWSSLASNDTGQISRQNLPAGRTAAIKQFRDAQQAASNTGAHVTTGSNGDTSSNSAVGSNFNDFA